MTSMFDYDDSINIAYNAKMAGKNLVTAKHEVLGKTGDFLFLAHSDREFALRCQMAEADIESAALRKMANVSDSKAKLVRALHEEWKLRHTSCAMCKTATPQVLKSYDTTAIDHEGVLRPVTRRRITGIICDGPDCGQSLVDEATDTEPSRVSDSVFIHEGTNEDGTPRLRPVKREMLNRVHINPSAEYLCYNCAQRKLGVDPYNWLFESSKTAAIKEAMAQGTVYQPNYNIDGLTSKMSDQSRLSRWLSFLADPEYGRSGNVDPRTGRNSAFVWHDEMLGNNSDEMAKALASGAGRFYHVIQVRDNLGSDGKTKKPWFKGTRSTVKPNFLVGLSLGQPGQPLITGSKVDTGNDTLGGDAYGEYSQRSKLVQGNQHHQGCTHPHIPMTVFKTEWVEHPNASGKKVLVPQVDWTSGQEVTYPVCPHEARNTTDALNDRLFEQLRRQMPNHWLVPGSAANNYVTSQLGDAVEDLSSPGGQIHVVVGGTSYGCHQPVVGGKTVGFLPRLRTRLTKRGRNSRITLDSQGKVNRDDPLFAGDTEMKCVPGATARRTLEDGTTPQHDHELAGCYQSGLPMPHLLTISLTNPDTSSLGTGGGTIEPRPELSGRTEIVTNLAPYEYRKVPGVPKVDLTKGPMARVDAQLAAERAAGVGTEGYAERGLERRGRPGGGGSGGRGPVGLDDLTEDLGGDELL